MNIHKHSPWFWVGIAAMAVIVVSGLVSGGVGGALVTVGAIAFFTGLYAIIFRRRSWLRLNGWRTATAVAGAGAVTFLIGGALAPVEITPVATEKETVAVGEETPEEENHTQDTKEEEPTAKPPVKETTSADAVEEENTYPSFDEVDPYTSEFFIALEDEGADPITYLGGIEATKIEQEFLWNMGVMFCEDLDDGKTVGAAIEFLSENSNMGDWSGSIGAAAVLDMCEEHLPIVETWVAENS